MRETTCLTIPLTTPLTTLELSCICEMRCETRLVFLLWRRLEALLLLAPTWSSWPPPSPPDPLPNEAGRPHLIPSSSSTRLGALEETWGPPPGPILDFFVPYSSSPLMRLGALQETGDPPPPGPSSSSMRLGAHNLLVF